MRKYYILNDNKEPVEASWKEYCKFLDTLENRIVKQETINNTKISTVFLGQDIGNDSGAPILFETMCFGGTLDGEQWRYQTFDEALKGHQKVREMVTGS
jgi:hypothetical protein